jgi:hypothetical protein
MPDIRHYAVIQLTSRVRFACVVYSLATLVTVGCADARNDQGDKSPGDLGAVRDLRTIGDSNSFGSIDAVQELANGRVAVLDAMNGRINLFSEEGSFLSAFGARGVGPGEFGAGGGGLQVNEQGNLLVLDRANMRLTSLSVDGDSLRLAGDVRLAFMPGGMCRIGDRLIFLGDQGGNLLHEATLGGEVVRSFAPRQEANPLIIALAASGRLACSEPGRVIALAPRTQGQVRIYSFDGELLRLDSIPGYSEIIYNITGHSVRPETPPIGYAHETLALHWLDEATLLVQLRRIGSTGSELEGRLLRIPGGWAQDAPAWPPIMTATESRIYAVDIDLYPLLKVFSRR